MGTSALSYEPKPMLESMSGMFEEYLREICFFLLENSCYDSANDKSIVVQLKYQSHFKSF